MGTLAIVNRSHSVVAWQRMRLSPGSKVRLSDFYASEADAHHDFDLMKFISRGKLEIVEVDFEAAHTFAAKIAELEAKADAERDAGNAKRKLERQNALARRGDHQLARQVERVNERKVREQKAEQKAELDLSALYEQTRKQRLIRATQAQREELEKAPEVAPVDALTHEAEVLGMYSESTSEEPKVKPFILADQSACGGWFAPESTELNPELPLSDRLDLPQHEREISAEALEQLREGVRDVQEGRVKAIPLDDLLGPDTELNPEFTSVQDQPEPVVTEPLPPVQSSNESITNGQAVELDSLAVDLDSLSDLQLRHILEEFSVKGRHVMKKRMSLLNAVKKLGLNDKDLAQSLSGMEQSNEPEDSAQG